jgi:hypothetical protein
VENALPPQNADDGVEFRRSDAERPTANRCLREGDDEMA